MSSDTPTNNEHTQQHRRSPHPFPQGISLPPSPTTTITTTKELSSTTPTLNPMTAEQQQTEQVSSDDPSTPTNIPTIPPLLLLPSELLMTILFFSDTPSILSFGSCNRYMHLLSNHPVVWRELYLSTSQLYWNTKKGDLLMWHLRRYVRYCKKVEQRKKQRLNRSSSGQPPQDLNDSHVEEADDEEDEEDNNDDDDYSDYSDLDDDDENDEEENDEREEYNMMTESEDDVVSDHSDDDDNDDDDDDDVLTTGGYDTHTNDNDGTHQNDDNDGGEDDDDDDVDIRTSHSDHHMSSNLPPLFERDIVTSAAAAAVVSDGDLRNVNNDDDDDEQEDNDEAMTGSYAPMGDGHARNEEEEESTIDTAPSTSATTATDTPGPSTSSSSSTNVGGSDSGDSGDSGGGGDSVKKKPTMKRNPFDFHSSVVQSFLNGKIKYSAFEHYVLSTVHHFQHCSKSLEVVKNAEKAYFDMCNSYLTLYPESLTNNLQLLTPTSPLSPSSAQGCFDFMSDQQEKQQQQEQQQEQQEKQNKRYVDWKRQVMDMKMYRLDSQLEIKFGKVDYSNDDHTAFNAHPSSSNWWETIRSRMVMTPGSVYHWSIYVDRLVKCPENLWWILIGVEVPQFKWELQDHWVDVIGFNEYRGSCLICGPLKKRYLGKEVPIKPEYANHVPQKDQIRTGDTIYVRFDTRYSSAQSNEILEKFKLQSQKDLDLYQSLVTQYQEESNNGVPIGATLEFWKNGQSEPCGKIIGISDLEFYPTVSIVHKQKVSIMPWNGFSTE